MYENFRIISAALMDEVDEVPEEKNQRVELYNAIQASIAEREDLEGSLLVSFVIVAEWKDPHDNSWLTKLSGDSFAELPPWKERMFGAELMNWDIVRHNDDCNCHKRDEDDV